MTLIESPLGLNHHDTGRAGRSWSEYFVHITGYSRVPNYGACLDSFRGQKKGATNRQFRCVRFINISAHLHKIPSTITENISFTTLKIHSRGISSTSPLTLPNKDKNSLKTSDFKIYPREKFQNENINK
jgi:hypothetical protein